MKKTSILLGMVAMSFFASAQTRMSLYEEFTGENCGPCAATNPGLNTLLAANANLVIPIKWQVPIPSAPTTTWSLYQTDKPEIDWRWQAAPSNYGYLCATCSPTANYINYAPQGRMDGQELNTFGINQGGSTNHPGYLTSAAISSAQAQATPFTITMTPTYDATFSNATVNIVITSSSTFTSIGALKMRVVLVERTINFPTPPGSNGEKDFYDVVRKCLVTTPSVVTTSMSDFGTVISNTWVAAQTQSITVTLAIPSYINDKGQMAFVGFIQDDGNKHIWQAFRTGQPAIPNDGKAMSVAVGGSVMCTTTISPTATLKNNGANAITAMTVTPYMNAVAGTPVVWSGSLAPGATTVINMGVSNPANGTNTYSIFISGVSGGDIVTTNNGASIQFFNTVSYAGVPVNQGFESPSFPPAGWATFNPTGASHQWEYSNAASGYGTSSAAARVFINWTSPGGTQDLYLPGTSLTGSVHPTFKFDFSYTQIDGTTNDRLDVNVSTDCGATWSSIWSNQGAAMATTPYNNSSLNIPTATQWSTATIPMYTYSNSPGVLVLFRATSGQGNVIWLDNVNLFNDATVGIKTNSPSTYQFEVYPNPAANEVNVSISTVSALSSHINISNTLGQVVVSKDVSLNAGNNTVQIDTKNLASGIYYVTYGSGKESVTKKLTITK